MGNGAAVSSSPSDIFAMKVIANDFDLISTCKNSQQNEGSAFASLLQNFTGSIARYSAIYNVAFNEAEKPMHLCKNPSVILLKYLAMTETDILSYQALVRESITAKSNNSKSSKIATDYSASFGGTLMDTKLEKEAAELLRGDQSNGSQTETNPYLIFPEYTHEIDRYILRKYGKWLKYFGGGCYMYIHSLTHEIVSIKPEDFTEDESNPNDGKSNNLTAIPVDISNGLPTIDINELPNEIHRIVTVMKKTPLILDTSEAQVVRSYYSYKAMLEDVSCLKIPFGKSGIKRTDVTERCRSRLVSALKTGGVFALYLGSCGIEEADWKKKLCKKDVFPIEIFINGGLKLLEPTYDPKYKAIYREADLEHGLPIVRDGFHSVIISTLGPFEFRDKLSDSVPLGYCHTVLVR